MEIKSKKNRIYVCHTYYHVYVSCLKELALPMEERGGASLVLSTMSNDFDNLEKRAKNCPLFEEVFIYEEKSFDKFPQLEKYHTDKGNLLLNMFARMKYTKLLGKYQEEYIPVDFKDYQDIYVFCDSDPIGYYLNYKKIYYHAVEDGLNCIQYYDTARYDNKGHFKFKAWMSSMNLIFIQNGYGKYCIDMEINDLSVVPYPCKKYIECSRDELVNRLTLGDKDILVNLFLENANELIDKIRYGAKKKVLVLTEPLCELEVRERIFRDIIEGYSVIDGEQALVIMKPHPRDELDYEKIFSEYIVLSGRFPMEIMNYIPGLSFDRVISVLTVPNGIKFAKEILFLGEDFLDKYEAPEIHRQNEHLE